MRDSSSACVDALAWMRSRGCTCSGARARVRACACRPRLGDSGELVLEVLDGGVLGVEDVVELLGDGAEHVGVEVGGGEHLAQLRVLLLEALVDGLEGGRGQ
eukprot:6209058-Pleurochrysis_carterae.AAC.1